MMNHKIILITGATAGFGEATARLFASNGWNLIITGRRQELLEELKNDIIKENEVKVFTLCFDIQDRAACEKAVASLPEDWKNIDVLLNNAGMASGLAPFHEGDVDDWELMIDTNVKGLLYLSRLIAPLMVSKRSGHIINLSSLAGKDAYYQGNIYCATKFAVEAITKSMRIDMLQYGIRVTSISPGAAETEFSLVRYKGDTERATKTYDGYQPLIAQDIAETVWFVVSRPAHVNISDVIITPTAQANPFYINKESK